MSEERDVAGIMAKMQKYANAYADFILFGNSHHEAMLAASAAVEVAVRGVLDRLVRTSAERDELNGLWRDAEARVDALAGERDALRAAGREFVGVVEYCVFNLRTVGVTDVRALSRAAEGFDAALAAPAGDPSPGP